ncbi:MAG: hypothetical protein ABWX67_17065 [Allosphingosinicella sp.]
MIRRFIGTYDLFNRQSGSLVECHLYEGFAENNTSDFLTLWKPLFDRKREELTAAGLMTPENLEALSLQDAAWNWPLKAGIASLKAMATFVVEAEGVTEGLMIAAPYGFAREPSQDGLPLTYIELLSTAPWNRAKLVPQPKYKGVGRLLMTAAVSLSLEEEQRGRIGLHALSGASEWYRGACGMSDLGYDEDKKMDYFEMTEAQASAFLS